MRDLDGWIDLLKEEAHQYAVEEMEGFIEAYEGDELQLYVDSDLVGTCAMAAMGGGGKEGYHRMLVNYGPCEVEIFFEGFGGSKELMPDSEERWTLIMRIFHEEIGRRKGEAQTH